MEKEEEILTKGKLESMQKSLSNTAADILANYDLTVTELAGKLSLQEVVVSEKYLSRLFAGLYTKNFFEKIYVIAAIAKVTKTPITKLLPCLDGLMVEEENASNECHNRIGTSDSSFEDFCKIEKAVADFKKRHYESRQKRP